MRAPSPALAVPSSVKNIRQSRVVRHYHVWTEPADQELFAALVLVCDIPDEKHQFGALNRPPPMAQLRECHVDAKTSLNIPTFAVGLQIQQVDYILH
jgi:hypothetical protein